MRDLYTAVARIGPRKGVLDHVRLILSPTRQHALETMQIRHLSAPVLSDADHEAEIDVLSGGLKECKR